MQFEWKKMYNSYIFICGKLTEEKRRDMLL